MSRYKRQTSARGSENHHQKTKAARHANDLFILFGRTRNKEKKKFLTIARNPLNLGSGGEDIGSSLVGVLLEVLVEEDSKLGDLVLEGSGGGPALLGVEELAGDTGAGGGDGQVEGSVGLVLGLGELAVVDGVQDGTGVLERATLAASGGTGADPAGVQEPGVDLVLLDLLGQHVGVAHGVKSQEGLSEARREGSLGLSDTILSTGHLGGVTGDEVEHGLLGGELGDGGQDTAGITGEQDDVGGVVVGDAGNLGVLDVLNGVGATGVLGKGGIVVVNNAGDGVENGVLENGTEADGVENIGLLLGGETNALGVAATLDVEDTGVGPAVLVVTNQLALGVSGQGGLASTGQTEEDGNITILTLVGRGVESQDVVLDGHLVVENGEDTLLHLTSVLGTKDNHLLVGEVDSHGGGGGHTLSEAVGRERTSVVDDIVGVEVLEFLTAWADQHVAHEESVVSTSADNANADAVALIPAGVTIDDIDAVAGVEVVDSTLTIDTPDLWGKMLVTSLIDVMYVSRAKGGDRGAAANAEGMPRDKLGGQIGRQKKKGKEMGKGKYSQDGRE